MLLRIFMVCEIAHFGYNGATLCMLIHWQLSAPIQNQPFSDVASPNNGGDKKLGGKMFGFRRATVFCSEYSVSKHKITVLKIRGTCPLGTPLAAPIFPCTPGLATSMIRALPRWHCRISIAET